MPRQTRHAILVLSALALAIALGACKPADEAATLAALREAAAAVDVLHLACHGQFRPDNPLLPNYKYVPIGYHGRASSIGVSGLFGPA